MPRRDVIHGDGLAFLARGPLPPDHAVVTSLPDVSELRLSTDAWRAWFVDAAAAVCGAISAGSVAVFFQSDIKVDGRWVDKGFLVQLGAERAGVHLLFHKVVCRAPAGVTTRGRPAYAHLLAFSKELRIEPARSTPDVLPTLGTMTWKKAMGLDACEAVCRFLIDNTSCRTVVDPFCGIGSVLAMANALDLDAIGVEISPKRAERARTLQVSRP